MLSDQDKKPLVIRCRGTAESGLRLYSDDIALADSPLFTDWGVEQGFELDTGDYDNLVSAILNEGEFDKVIGCCNQHHSRRWKQVHWLWENSETVCVIFTDVTDLVEQHASALASLKFLNMMHDQMPDLFYYKDRQSRYLGGNRIWCKHHGATDLSQMLGKTDLDSPRMTPQDREDLFNEEQNMMSSGGMVRRREQMVDPKDGKMHYFESIKTSLFNENQEIVGLVGMTRDVTAQYEAEQEAIRARAEAEQATKAKSSFLAVMSHEIRTPMNGVIGCTSLLSNTELSPEQENLVKTIQNCGEGLLVIINDILDYSKIEAGHLALEHSPFYLRPLIEECIELFSKQVIDKRLELNYYIMPDVPFTLFGDANRIRQIINNLLGNAVKFTDRGEIYIEVTATSVDMHSQDCKLQIAIRDTGIGIPREGQARIFSAFTQADPSITRKYGGTGLGLVICRKIVQQMGGDIWFKSVPGTGTTFYFSMQLNFDIDHMQEQMPAEWVDLKDLRVLVVDDNPTNRKVLSNTLINWEMKPTVFESPKGALENLSLSQDYDLVLLDFCMPHMDGGELAMRIKNFGQMKNVPMVLLSSVQQGRQDEYFNATLLKPVRNSTLKRTLLHVMGAKQTKVVQSTKAESENRKSTRVLIVEDNTVNQMVVAMMLKKLGYHQVVTVADGVEAVSICQQQEFDVILMDIQMERMDGYTASEKIRERIKLPDRPWIIALTAGAQQEDAEKAYASGMNAFVTKPIQIGGLKQAIEEGEDHLFTPQ